MLLKWRENLLGVPTHLVKDRKQRIKLHVQSTLVISKSKGPSKKLRDIRTSTYQMCSSEENNNLNNQNLQRTM